MVIGHLLMGYSLPVMSLFSVVALYLVPEGLIKPFGSRKPILEKTRYPRDFLFKGAAAQGAQRTLLA